MRCGFCGEEFDQELANQGCGGCTGGCHSVHCPRCNYKNPLEPKFMQKLRKLVRKS